MTHPLVRACEERHAGAGDEPRHFAVYLELATRWGGLGLTTPFETWLADALAFSEQLMVDAIRLRKSPPGAMPFTSIA